MTTPSKAPGAHLAPTAFVFLAACGIVLAFWVTIVTIGWERALETGEVEQSFGPVKLMIGLPIIVYTPVIISRIRRPNRLLRKTKQVVDASGLTILVRVTHGTSKNLAQKGLVFRQKRSERYMVAIERTSGLDLYAWGHGVSVVGRIPWTELATYRYSVQRGWF